MVHLQNTKCSSGGSSGSSGGGITPPSDPINEKPVANASAGEPYQGYVNAEITFDGSNSYDLMGTSPAGSGSFGDNTNGTGEIVKHIYSKPGTYNVTLTVTDNKGATDTTTTVCIISQPNRPPTQPVITGPTKGPKNTKYTYTAVSTDPDNDTLQYTFDWGDPLYQSQSSGFLPSGTSFSASNSWVAAGRYDVTVTVTDNQTMSSSK
jgi:trimeric autotransporter adhesin